MLFLALLFLQAPVLDPGVAGFDPLPLLQLLAKGAQAGNWGPVVVAALILTVWLARFLAAKFPGLKALAWVRSTWGGWALNLGGSLLAAVLTMALAGPITAMGVVSAVIAALVTGLASAGAVELKKDLLGGAAAAGEKAGLSVVTKQDALNELK